MTQIANRAKWILVGLLLILSGSVDLPVRGAEPPARSDEALVLPEFAAALDVERAASALRQQDSATLAALASRLGDAERKAGRQNPLSAATLFRAALQSAQQQHSLDAVNAVEKALVSAALAESDRSALQDLAATARKIVTAPRKPEIGPGLKPRDVTPESVALYNAFLREIRVMKDYGLDVDVQPIADAVEQIREFHPKQRAHLLKLLGEAQVAIRERETGDPTLTKLAMSARQTGGTLDFRIVGPDVVEQGGTVLLALVPVSAAAARPGTLILKSMPGGVQFPDADGRPAEWTLPWTGHSQVVRVQVPDSGAARLSGGLASDSMTSKWYAIIR